MMRTIANNHSALSSSSFSNVPLELLAGRSVGKYVLHKSVPVEVHASEYDVSLYVPSLEEYGGERR
jgi:hypothetical protein